jgi:MoaA/NifB/PqqE/SkfB family radical SAM enzyme
MTSINLRIPAELAQEFGLGPGSDAEAVALPDGLLLRRSADHLTKVYVEVTTACNLSCRTCVRNAWDEPVGTMPLELFERLLEHLRAFPRPLTVFFGGYGEPLTHHHLIRMLHMAKAGGARVELITNGTLMDESFCRALIDAGVDRVWVSIDGLTPTSYANIRHGGQLGSVQENLRQLYVQRCMAGQRTPAMGLAFVAMKSNIGDLASLLRFASYSHVQEVMVTNVLPHTPDMLPEILYRRTIGLGPQGRSRWPPLIHLPRLDLDAGTSISVADLMRSIPDFELGGARPLDRTDYCPFIEAGSTAIRWDGQVSPCLPLLHSHPEYALDRRRQVRHASFGNIAELSLTEIWHSPEYKAFRRRVRAFDFPPCVFCGGCQYAEENEEDCFENTFPTCGGCLWAQGVIQCP